MASVKLSIMLCGTVSMIRFERHRRGEEEIKVDGGRKCGLYAISLKGGPAAVLFRSQRVPDGDDCGKAVGCRSSAR